MKTFYQFNEGRAQDMQQKVKDKIKPEFHDKYDFKKIKTAQAMLNFLNRAKMYNHLKENANQERVREKIKAEKEADKEKHDRMMDRARIRDTRVANAKEEAELDEGKKKGLWYNIHQKRKRGEKPNPPGHPDRPTEQDFKNASKGD